ncbi:MoaF-related domain-containing protein [Desulforhopalus sp. 52FAK]
MITSVKKSITLAITVAALTIPLSATAQDAPFKSVEYTWNEGDYAGARYKLDLQDNSIRWEGLAGEEKGAFAVEKKVAYVDLDDNRQMITWHEASGYTVTLVANTKSLRIDGVVSNKDSHVVIGGKIDKLKM